MLHQTIGIEYLDSLYAGTAEVSFDWSPVHSMFNIWCCEQMRRQLGDNISSEEKVPADLFVWGRGEPSRTGLTKVGGVPEWPAGKPLPDGLKYVGQMSLVDSLEFGLPMDGDVISIWADDSFPYRRLEAFTVDSRDLAAHPDKECVESVAGKPPFYGVIYRTFDVPRTTWERLGIYEYQWQFRQGEFTHLPWHGTKIGGIPTRLDRKNQVSKFICELGSIQAEPEQIYPWVNVAAPLEVSGAATNSYASRENKVSIGDLGTLSFFLDGQNKVAWRLDV